MKKINHLRSIAGILVVFFLFTSIVAGYLNTLQTPKEIRALSLDKKATSHSHSDTLLPYEEKEKENEEENRDNQNHFFFICMAGQPVLFTISAPQAFFLYNAPRSCGNATDIPIYLATRSLLI
jgi:preprotein translocase subunit SecG